MRSRSLNGVKLAVLGLQLDTGNFAVWLSTAVVALTLSVLTVVAVRRVLGPRSLYVTGSTSSPPAITEPGRGSAGRA